MLFRSERRQDVDLGRGVQLLRAVPDDPEPDTEPDTEPDAERHPDVVALSDRHADRDTGAHSGPDLRTAGGQSVQRSGQRQQPFTFRELIKRPAPLNLGDQYLSLSQSPPFVPFLSDLQSLKVAGR